ncbi:hypothetical protein Xoosp13_72 [Xanthomonas phage Xoo-sp13]|nr:hypothetical protein Xoosp13_72 [Xanthomonas phage Xoo-sp13]
MKRNDIVFSKEEQQNGWILYGRVWKVLKDGRLVVVCGGSHVSIYNPDELVLSDYKGYFRRGRWVPMDSLKRLKLYASMFNPYFAKGKRWSKDKRKKALAALEDGIHWIDMK